ncbi:transposase [Amycolatopsis dendrobii]|uniref:Transposase n=1 Tax=Amycolatopsis dendrobii TaxID=2760662 RepID=A0A7W3Z8L1_9PSEU|nr:transposase [Amycolatopsis dendrobii]MBB1152501.1 transposase [Amycolatopsis dendrobii]
MQYELLANHLDPTFGNIYDLGVPGNGAQGWTAELRAAASEYLSAGLPSDVLPWLQELSAIGPEHSDEGWTDELIDTYDPGELGWLVRRAAVAAVPSLGELLEGRSDWGVPAEDMKADVATWLDVHATHDQLMELADRVGYVKEASPSSDYELLPDGFDIAEQASPPELLRVWESVTASAVTDLTDSEWDILCSCFPPRRGGGRYRTYELEARRQAFDAVRFKMANSVPWSAVPWRYGKPPMPYFNFRRYARDGLFESLAKSLPVGEDTRRLSQWVNSLADGAADDTKS